MVAHCPHDLRDLHVCPGPLSSLHLNDDTRKGPNVCVRADPFRKGLRLKGLGLHVVEGTHNARAVMDCGLQDHVDAKVGKHGLVVCI